MIYILLIYLAKNNQKYEIDIHSQNIIRGFKPISFDEIYNLNEQTLLINSGNEIIQFFLQSMDGEFSIKVGHFVLPSGASLAWLMDRIKDFLDIYFETKYVEIIASSSDGDLWDSDLNLLMDIYMQCKYNLF